MIIQPPYDQILSKEFKHKNTTKYAQIFEIQHNQLGFMVMFMHYVHEE